MKHTFLSLFLLFSIVSFGQVEWEHTYNNALITRINLEYSGEKYYEFKTATNELVFYNADHSLWKTILLPAPLPSMFTRTTLFHVSEAKINPDSNLEIMFGYYGNSGFECKVISEDGSVITTINNVNSVQWSAIPGLPDKLITTFYNGSYSSKVYSLPGFTLENAYPEGVVSRVKLENSGEKFYVLDKTNGNIKLYNQDHSPWKTIALPKPVQAVYANISIVSETQINPDALLEIGYTYYTDDNSVFNYTGKIINESNAELITMPQAKSMAIDVLQNSEDKLMVTTQNYSSTSGYSDASSVYQLPSLVLEKAYESVVSRVHLENSGEKYYTSENMADGFARIYNANHTLWKSIFLDIPFEGVYVYLGMISETKIASDPLLEIGYSYVYHSPLMYDEWYGQVMNENGLVYLNSSGTQSYVLSEIPNAPTKLIEVINFPDVFENTNNYTTNVYNVGTLATDAFQSNTLVSVSPNPAASIINITAKNNIVEAVIYSSNGMEVQHQKANGIHQINVENLSAGMYLLTLRDNNNQKTVRKIAVSH